MAQALRFECAYPGSRRKGLLTVALRARGYDHGVALTESGLNLFSTIIVIYISSLVSLSVFSLHLPLFLFSPKYFIQQLFGGFLAALGFGFVGGDR